MFENIKDLKNSMKALKELQSQFGNVDMTNPESMLKSMGLNVNEINQHFEGQFTSSVDLNFVNNSDNQNPEYAYKGDSGFDLRASEEKWIFPNSRVLIPTGLKFDIPDGYEIHHVNHIQDDNHIMNLEVMEKSIHRRMKKNKNK